MTNTFLSYNVVVLLHKSHNYELYHLAIPDLSRTFTCSAKLCNLGFSPHHILEAEQELNPPTSPQPEPTTQTTQPMPPPNLFHQGTPRKPKYITPPYSTSLTPPLATFPRLSFRYIGTQVFWHCLESSRIPPVVYTTEKAEYLFGDILDPI